MADSTRPEQLRQDLGLGGRLSERSRARLLNHDGTFNVRRNTLGPLHPYNAYHTLLSLPVGSLFGVVAIAYLLTNLGFALLYWLGGPGTLIGAADRPLPRFEDSLFFSVQTLSTIGYGRLSRRRAGPTRWSPSRRWWGCSGSPSSTDSCSHASHVQLPRSASATTR